MVSRSCSHCLLLITTTSVSSARAMRSLQCICCSAYRNLCITIHVPPWRRCGCRSRLSQDSSLMHSRHKQRPSIFASKVCEHESHLGITHPPSLRRYHHMRRSRSAGRRTRFPGSSDSSLPIHAPIPILHRHTSRTSHSSPASALLTELVPARIRSTLRARRTLL